VSTELLAWLAADHAVAPDAWEADPPLEELRCHPDLVERFASLVRPMRPRVTFVAGCPVAHHPSGPPFAAAFGTRVLVARDAAASPLVAAPALDDLPPGWAPLEPWPSDVAFAKGTDLLRAALARAFDCAGAGGSPDRPGPTTT
jgi:hypothetical protein